MILKENTFSLFLTLRATIEGPQDGPSQAETGVGTLALWFCMVCPEELRGAGSDFPCCGGTLVVWPDEVMK